MSALDFPPPKSPSPRQPLTPSRHKLLDTPDPRIGHTRVEDESDIERTYVMGEILGKGGFGVVLEVRHRVTGVKYAMKIVSKDKPGSVSIQLLEREVEVLKRVNHPNIIRLEEVFETSQKMYMIMELCKGGELSAELKKKHFFRENDAKIVMRKIVEAVVYMHDCDMVHRDLKLDNVLLSTADPDNEFNIKVTDFGLCYVKGLRGCEVSVMDNKCGTLLYMAPEVIQNRHDYTKMCDVWSLGVIMYCLLCGRYPYRSSNPARLEEMIFSGKLSFNGIEWENVSEAAKVLISNMMCIETTDRFTARRILDDAWFTGEAPKRFLNAMDLMRDMANEQAVLKKLQETGAEQEITDMENATDIIVSTPSGSLEPTGTYPISSNNHGCLTDLYENENPLNSKRKPSRLRTSVSQSATHKRPNTQASPSRKPGVLKQQTHSSSVLSSPTKRIPKTSSSSPSTTPNHKASYSGTHFSRPRGASVGSKGTLLSPCSSTMSPTHRSITTACGSSSGNCRERTSTSPSRLRSPIGRTCEALSPIGSSSHASCNSEKLTMSLVPSSHSPRGRRHSATPSSSSLNSHSSQGKKKSVSVSSTTSLSPSTSPRVSPRVSPRSSPRNSPRVSPRFGKKSLSPKVSPMDKKPPSSPNPKPKKAFPSDRRSSSPNP